MQMNEHRIVIFVQGAPSVEFLNQPITSLDHPFLRANVESIRAHKIAVGGKVNFRIIKLLNT